MTPSFPLSAGIWLSSGSPVVTDLAARCRPDWLLLDMEHGAITEADLLTHLWAAGDCPVVVRLPDHDFSRIGRVLDWGAHAVMVPHVNSADEARAIVEAMRWPPEGKRGFSRSVRSNRYGLPGPGVKSPARLYAQIETGRAVTRIEEIAAVPGVDVLFVGPADLAVSLSAEPMGFDGEAALARVAAAAATRGIEAGLLVRDETDMPKRRAQGYTQIALHSDISLLRSGFMAQLELQRSVEIR